MTSLKVRPLRDDLTYGARITGVSWEALRDDSVRKRIKDVFDSRGMIVFEEMEPSNKLQVALSDVFGPLQDHALKMGLVDKESMPGVVDLDYKGNVSEIDGKPLLGMVPWHFDACYTAKLNRGGVLRAITIPPEGGLTGFADGVQIYEAIPPELRAKCADKKIIYYANFMWMNMRFGKPKGYRIINLSDDALQLIEETKSATRSVHPMIWKRKTGEYVFHLSPWQAAGIQGHEHPEGDALLEALCQEMYAKMVPYYHQWKPTDMITWDNWRFMHYVSGNDPKYDRRMFRTTINGDYGLGCFESDADNTSLKMSM
jgi:taurine dioxygenase